MKTSPASAASTARSDAAGRPPAPRAGGEERNADAAQTGARIRARRLDLGLRQGELAAEVGISSAYLNLIEHGKRRIGGKVLMALARALAVEPTGLTQGADPGLRAALLAAAARPVAEAPAPIPREMPSQLPAETARIDALVARFPGWAGLITAQAAEIDALETALVRQQHRLRSDPALAETMHAVLSSATAIRSMADILASDAALEEAWRARFHRNLHEEAERLSEQATWLLTRLQEAPDAPEG